MRRVRTKWLLQMMKEHIKTKTTSTPSMNMFTTYLRHIRIWWECRGPFERSILFDKSTVFVLIGVLGKKLARYDPCTDDCRYMNRTSLDLEETKKNIC